MLSLENRALISAAALADPAFAARAKSLGIATDWGTEGVNITNFAAEVPEGDAIFVDVAARVFDIYAGIFFNTFQVAIAAAVVDDAGNADPSLRNVQGAKNAFSSNVITINHLHLYFSPMPKKTVNVQVKLFANHDDGPSFNWSAWDGSSAGGWDLLDTKKLVVKNPGAGQMNWLLIGGAVLAVGVAVAVAVTFKAK